jgi:7-cyano-7-deazaguanine synthase
LGVTRSTTVKFLTRKIDSRYFMSSPNDALVLFSGGIDSTACVHLLLESGHDVRPLFVDYGQKAAWAELAAARELVSEFSLVLYTMTVKNEVAYGPGEIAGRNAFLIFSAMLGGFCSGNGSIALGIHFGTPYYDCSPAFIGSIDRLVREYTDGCRRVVAPLLNFTKRDILAYCIERGLPLERTYSCEAGEVPPCGKCLSCQDRKKNT